MSPVDLIYVLYEKYFFLSCTLKLSNSSKLFTPIYVARHKYDNVPNALNITFRIERGNGNSNLYYLVVISKWQGNKR